MKTFLLFTVIISATFAAAQAQVRITEVNPWSSGSSPYMADWFELTNMGSAAVNISGWTMDDDSNNPNSALLSGVSSIAPGESVVFLELAGGGNANALLASFINTWFGASGAPAGLQIGTYTQGVAGGVGLGTGGDAVNIFSGTAGTLQARIAFGASDSVSPLQTFDNAVGQDGTTISTLSMVGVNGAFTAVNDANEVGSPGRIAAVPEPQTYGMMLIGTLALLGFSLRRRRA